MAKKENTTEVTGGLSGTESVLDGLSFGASKTARQGGQKPDPVPPAKPAPAAQEEVFSAYGGKKKRHERKSFKTNILIKPSYVDRMDKAIDSGYIKSRNDLINSLLERHFALEDALAEGRIKTREEVADFLIQLHTAVK